MKQAPVRERRAITVHGIVQGVGFRPFIYALALRHDLAGWVRNDTTGVSIEVEGTPEALDSFLQGVRAEAPPLAMVETLTWQPCAPQGVLDFHIEESREGAQRRALISPDVATCAACLDELFDPANRRYRYPFINCTNCGPRFSITRAVPYDRALTTMAAFSMCAACQAEYDSLADRRFHAQPNACPVCGPRIQLLDRQGVDLGIPPPDVIAHAARLLREGAILAIKGLGGYHLACDPCNPDAVHALRCRKARQDKPFALMARDLAQARALCQVGPEEATLLTSLARPIVLLLRRTGDGVTADVAPRQTSLGMMLAYTPLHHLLLHDMGAPLVMTSGNRSDEPIAYQDEEALARLGDIADYFLAHNRPIHMRCDDSVARIVAGAPYLTRRSRGYAPAPLTTVEPFSRHILACGGELKNTFCLAKEQHAFLSHHIGDLENYETNCSFQEGIAHYCGLFDVQPQLVAYDLHPEYLSTKYARELEEQGLSAIGVQHHHAHIASCLADNERPIGERVIGVALDGTGYGTDGTIWGGEFFAGSIQAGFARRAHLALVPLPGGEAAIRQPWRIAVGQLIALYGEAETLALPLAPVQEAGVRQVRLIARMLEGNINTPRTSSAGRLFDLVGALVGVPGTQRTTYEGQAAIELELVAQGATCLPQIPEASAASTLDCMRPQSPPTLPCDRSRGCVSVDAYPFRLRPEGDGWVVETEGIVTGVVEDLLQTSSAGLIAARFHRTMADIVATCCVRIREASGIGAVALSGGTFQNMLLLRLVMDMLTRHGFMVHRHRRVPANDGGLALGQAVLADHLYRAPQE
jgi:hydrogenase maturation protein HypF